MSLFNFKDMSKGLRSVTTLLSLTTMVPFATVMALQLRVEKMRTVDALIEVAKQEIEEKDLSDI